MAAKTHIKIKNINKIFPDKTQALDSINLEVGEGEILVLLGPSGCGKSTLLRIIGGLETKTEGEIYFYDNEISNVPVEKRDVGFVFQNYALFPTMTVRENIRFGLKLRKKSKEYIRKKVDEMLELMNLMPFADKKPSQLSGGQQQRVALARVLAIEPTVLLMDEPLTALDAKLKEHLRIEMGLLFRRLGITIIYVTHDQIEAMAIADRVAVMSKGVIEQVDTPEKIYTSPATDFVVDFIGKINTLTGKVIEKGGEKYVDLGFITVPFPAWKNNGMDNAKVFLRPEDISLVNDEDEYHAEAIVEQSTFLGSYCHILALINDQEIFFNGKNTQKLSKGDKIKLHIDTGKLIIMQG